MVKIQGKHVLHLINQRTGECRCSHTHPSRAVSGWDVTLDIELGPLAEIRPLYTGALPDCYPDWSLDCYPRPLVLD